MLVVYVLISIAIGFALGILVTVLWPEFASRELAVAKRAAADANLLRQHAELEYARLRSHILSRAKLAEAEASGVLGTPTTRPRT